MKLLLDNFLPLATAQVWQPTPAITLARLRRLAWSQSGEKLAGLAAQNELQIWHLRELRSGLRTLQADWSA